MLGNPRRDMSDPLTLMSYPLPNVHCWGQVWPFHLPTLLGICPFLVEPKTGPGEGHMLGSGAAMGPLRMCKNRGAPGACSQLHRLPGDRGPAQHSDSSRTPNPAPAYGPQAQSGLAEGPREPAQAPVKKSSGPQAAELEAGCGGDWGQPGAKGKRDPEERAWGQLTDGWQGQAKPAAE